MGQEPKAKWAPDPYRRHEYRFWDGHQWTDHVLVQGSATLDPIAFAVVPPPGQGGVAPSEADVGPGENRGQDGPLGFLSTRGHALLAVVTVGAWALALPGVYLWRSARPWVSFGYAAALLGLVTVVGITAGGPAVAPVAGAPALRAAGSGPDAAEPGAAEPGAAEPGVPGPAAGSAGSGTLTTPGSAARPTTGPAAPGPGAVVGGAPAGSAPPAGTTSTDPRASQGRTSAGPATPTVSPTTGAPSPRTTTTQAAPAPATSTSSDPEPKVYPNCKKLHADYAHGVGLPGAVDEVQGSKTPVTEFVRDGPLYAANSELDRDADGIACEA